MRYLDYEPPARPSAVIDGGRVPLDNAAVNALAQNAMELGGQVVPDIMLEACKRGEHPWSSDVCPRCWAAKSEAES